VRIPGITAFQSGFGEILIAFILGGMAATAFAPIHLVPVAIVALSLLSSLVIKASSIRKSFVLGWAFGFGHFAIGLQWLAESFSVDPERFGSYAVPAVLALSGLLAIFPAVACSMARTLRTRSTTANAFLISATWTASEMLRSVLFGGFPWNLIGHIWSVYDPAIQIAAFIGASGLTFVTVLAAAMCMPGPVSSGWLRRMAYSGAIILAVLIAGELRLFFTANPGGSGMYVRIVQGNVPQAIKWQADKRTEILSRYIELTGQPASRRLSAIIWPETAVPFDLFADTGVRARIGAAIPEGSILFAGTLRIGADGSNEIFNSIVAFGRDTGIQMVYDKVRLVPFGEYVPFRSFLSVGKLTVGSSDLSPGHVTGTFEVQSLPPVVPLICYEAIFPPGDTESGRPQWILNVTNDAWFGRSAGPYQHLEIAKFRSVELGLPMVRAANTGISAFIDPFGRVLKQIPIEETGILDFELPRQLATPTFYSIVGSLPVLVLVLLILIGASAARFAPTFLRSYFPPNRQK